MIITRRPLWADRDEPHRPHMCVALLFPVCSGVRVSAQCLFKATHRTSKIRKLLLPPLWASVRREADPCRITLHLRLNVGLLRVSDLDGVTRNAAEDIDSLSRLKRCKRAAQILKDSVLVMQIVNLICLEKTRPVYFLRCSASSESCQRKYRKDILDVQCTPPPTSSF